MYYNYFLNLRRPVLMALCRKDPLLGCFYTIIKGDALGIIRNKAN